jgi:hypothetical protein
VARRGRNGLNVGDVGSMWRDGLDVGATWLDVGATWLDVGDVGREGLGVVATWATWATSPPFHVYSRTWDCYPGQGRTPEKLGDVSKVKKEELPVHFFCSLDHQSQSSSLPRP